MKSLGRIAIRWAVFGVCFMATIEMASRIDQWWTYGAPILGVYTYDTALFATDDFGIHGRPNGRYEKWRLNSFGFRGDGVAIEKPFGQIRIVCIGASETFGLYEAAGNEWPRRLEQILRSEGVQAEVINAAIAGMSLPQRTRHLKHRLLRFSPDTVVMMLEYGSYAGLTTEKVQMRRHSPAVLPGRSDVMDGLKSLRVASRVKDIILPKFPAFLRDALWNVEYTIRLQLIKRELGASYRLFAHVTPFEIEMFKGDLEELYAITRAAGVKLIVASPAMWFSDRNVAGTYLSWPYLDKSWWREARTIMPAVAKEFAQSHEIDYVNVSESVQGQEELLMTDFLHFNDRGAEVLGRRIAQLMLVQKRTADISQ